MLYAPYTRLQSHNAPECELCRQCYDADINLSSHQRRHTSQAHGVGAGNNTVDAYDVSMGMDEMAKRLAELDRLVTNEPKARREDFRRRVDHLRNSYSHIKQQLDSYARKAGINLAHRGQRADLFAGAAGQDMLDKSREFAELQQLEAAEGGTLNRSNRMIGEYLQTGIETLAELQDQRSRLKGVQKKVLDIMTYLGISNSIMKTVTDRDYWDAKIAYGGMALVMLLVLYLWRNR